jgi:hypothetical protein
MGNKKKYKLSFTGVSLALSESVIVAEIYLQIRDWKAVEQKVKRENLIKARTKSSVQRVYQEIWPRLSLLTDEVLEVLVESTPQEQKYILWYAICQRYNYIREFAVEVVHEKYLRLDYELTDFDYDAFYNRKADWHPELDQLKESTRDKIKPRIFWMLREAGLISDDNMIIPANLSGRVIDVIADSSLSSLQIFPISPAEIQR